MSKAVTVLSMEPSRLSRRALLTAASATFAGTALLALPITASASDPDADLIEMGRRFDALHRQWAEIRPAYYDASNALSDAMAAERAFLTQVSKTEGEDGFLREFSRIHAEAGMTAIEKQALPLFEQLDQLSEEFLKARPQTIAGLAVQARAMAYVHESTWDRDEEALDYRDYVARRTVESVLALAGVDLFGRPVGRES